MSSGLDFRGVSVVPAVFAVVTFPVNVGGKRAWVAASKPEASLMSVGSLNAVPRKLIPIVGIPSSGEAAASPAPGWFPPRRATAPISKDESDQTSSRGEYVETVKTNSAIKMVTNENSDLAESEHGEQQDPAPLRMSLNDIGACVGECRTP